MKSKIITVGIGLVIILGLVTTVLGQQALADPNNYRQGFKAGQHDAKTEILHQSKLHYVDGEPTPWTAGYLAGFRAMCPKVGLATGPDSPCELTMDRGNP